MTRILIAFLSVFLTVTSLARAQPVDGGKALVELISAETSAQAGDTVTLALKLEMDPGWHVYWRNPGDAGLPPQIIWNEATTAEFDAFQWPLPETLPVVPNQIMDYGYSDVVVLPFTATLPVDAAGTYTFSGTADYLICEEICIPETAPVSLTLDIGAPSQGANAGLILQWQDKTPAAFDGNAVLDRGDAGWTLSLAPSDPAALKDAELHFFPYDHHIVHSAPQPVSFGEAGACLALSEATDGFDTSTAPEGIVVAETPDGARTGYRLTAADGGFLPGTCTERPAMPEIAQAGIGSGDYEEGPTEITGAAASDLIPPSCTGALVSFDVVNVDLGLPGTPAKTVALTPPPSINLLAVLPLVFLGGLILNLMPCVLPVLSLKALGMTHAAASGHASELRVHGLAYTAGVILSFMALAIAFLGVRSALGDDVQIGFQLQHAPTVLILALIVFLIGLWLLGTFELGSSIQNTGSGLAAKQGATGAFFTGVLAAVVGAPCVGPFVGASLGAVFTQPAGTVLLGFFTLGFGMALPFLLLSFAPNLQKLLPKPGPWMETLKQFFAFPMFLTAAWLIFVLGRLTDSSVVGWTIAGASAMAFGVWALKNMPTGGAMRTAAMGVGAIALIGGLGAPIWQTIKPPPKPVSDTAIVADWSPECVDDLLDRDHGIFIDFTAAWCVTCQANKASTLSRKDVKLAMAENNVAFLTADFTKRDPVIAAELAKYKQAGVPMYLFYPPGERAAQLVGPVLTPGLVIGLVSGN